MSKYRVMFLLSKKENLNDLYKFATTEIDGVVSYREFATLEEADAYIETLLNQHGYSKEDILLVREKEFDVCIQTEDSGTGESGQDGFSPIAKVIQTETGATITITDKTGTTTATVNNGKDGKDGTDGTDGTDGINGADGFSPSITESAENNDTVYKLDITNKQGKITTPNLKGAKGIDGEDGAPGEKGDKGEKGEKGDTGTSIRFKEVWTPTTEYVNNSQYIDIVTHDGNTYGCKTSHTSGDSWDDTNWILIASKGSKGDTGEKGATGADGSKGDKGDSGATWLFGNIAPTSEGKDEDFYLDTTTYDIYNKENGIWTKKGNIKGATGEKGADGTNGTDGQDGAPGISAGFGTPTATVDNNIGIPSVTITATGENTAKIFNFDFKNLKGEKGDKGDKGDTGATGQDGAPGTDGTDGTDGKDGFSPSIVENSANDDSTYKLDITTKTGSFTTPNLKGSSGTTSTTTPLSGKKILLCGDSIMRGAGWSGAYKNLIEEDFPDAIVYNYAVDGAKFTTNSIYDQFYEAAITDSLTPDIILFNGGGNDILVGKSLGTVDEDSAIDLTNLESYDDTTMLGAFEKLLANMNNVESLYSAHIGYINTYKLKSGVYSGESTVPEISVQRSSWEQVQKLCNKWSIPCLDLFNKSNIDSNNSMCVSKYFKNGTDIVHVNEAGYRKLWPMVREFLLTLS